MAMPIERKLRLGNNLTYLTARASKDGNHIHIEIHDVGDDRTGLPDRRVSIDLNADDAAELNEFIDHEMGM
jgi:hypothetical protein